MCERAVWSVAICTGLGILLGACQLNDTDSAPPAPGLEEEPTTSASTSPARAGEQGDDGEESSNEPADAAAPEGAPFSGGGASAAQGIDASVPVFPGLDAGLALPTLDGATSVLDGTPLSAGFDAAMFLPIDLAFPDSSAIGPIDAGLALGD